MKRIIVTGVIVAAVFALMAGVRPAVAVDNLDLFELDGDAIDNPAIGDDWATLYSGGGNATVFTGILPDPGQNTIFIGGKKDIQDIPTWGWKNDGGFPDKDDITNAYGAAYFANNGDLILYFGCDRFANNGDAFLGFWFFQNRVTTNPNGTFNGTHKTGDILVLVNYPQASNATPQIKVVEWNPAGANVATNLKLLSDGAECAGGGGLACAITNGSNQNSPWPYTPKSGTSGIFPYESFFEGGINLTKLLGSLPCFTSFLAESRSSKMFTATLKDFVLGDFPVCGISVSKKCDVVRLANQNDNTDKFFVVDFNGVVTNTGAGSLPKDADLTIVDDAGTPGILSDDVVIQQTLTDTLESGDSVPFSGKFFSNLNPPLNTVKAWIDFSSVHIEATPFSIDCNHLVLNPNLELSKLCWTRLYCINSLLAIEVLFSGTIENTGDVPLTVTVTDDKAGGVVFGPTLMEPGDHSDITGSYLPLHANGDVDQPCIANFSDTFTAVGTSPVPGVNKQTEIITANCKLCNNCD